MSRSGVRLAVFALACCLRVHPSAAQTDVSGVQRFGEWTSSDSIDAFTDEVFALRASTQDRRNAARLELVCDVQNGPAIRLRVSFLVRNDLATYQVRWDDLPPSDQRTIRFWNPNRDWSVTDDFPNSLYFPSREWRRMLDALGEHQRLRIRFRDREMMDFSLTGFSEAFHNLDCFSETRVAEQVTADSLIFQRLMTAVRPTLANREEVMSAIEQAYPSSLHDIGGYVVLWVFINERGRVQDSRVSQSSRQTLLDVAALSITDVMRFSPALIEDEGVKVWVQIPITFSVR